MYSNETWFTPYIDQITLLINNLVNSKSIEDRSKNAAIEILAAIAECYTDVASASTVFASTAIPLLLKLMTDIKDDPEWYTTEDVNIEFIF